MRSSYWYKVLYIPFIICVLVALDGCSVFSGYPTNFESDSAILAANRPFLGADVRTKGDDPSDAARGGLSQRQYRNTVVYRRLEVIDIHYYEFESKLTGTYNALGVGADLTTLILNGLGATTGAAETKAALAAASAGVIGAKSVINTDIFYQKTIPALIIQMRADRQAVLVNIEKGLSESASKYPLDQALMDVSLYYIAGTLPSAISRVTAQAGVALAASNNELSALRNSSFESSESATKRIVAWLYPNGDEMRPPINANRARLTQWMRNDRIDPDLGKIPFYVFLHAKSSALESDRQRALTDLNIP